MKKISSIIVTLFVVVLLILVSGFVQFGIGDKPVTVMEDGKVARALNCDNPLEEHKLNCASIICQISLFDTDKVKAYTRTEVFRKQHEFSNKPGLNIHFIRVHKENGEVYFKCTMHQLNFVNIEEVLYEDIEKF